MSEKTKISRKNNGLSQGKKEAIRALLNEYDISSINSIEEAIKDLLRDTIKELMISEMDDVIGAQPYERTSERQNYRNGYKNKKVQSRYGELDIKVPQDRNSEYSPTIIPKGEKDISHIDEKIINLYARGISTREISEIIEDIYGFEVDDSFVSRVTDKMLPIAQEWNIRPLDSMYPVVFIDATYFSVREEGRVSKKAAYVILGINFEGIKDVLSIEVGDNESSKYWLSVMNSLKNRGLRDILILCSDRLTGIKEAIEVAYPHTQWQGCTVHLVRDTLRYISNKDRKELTTDLKTIYLSETDEKGLNNLDKVKEKWEVIYKGIMDRWYDNWDNISPMFVYSERIRKMIYTTNAIESLNSSYKRLNKSRRVFPSKNSLFKALYLSTEIILKKWTQPIKNWGIIIGEFRLIFGDERVKY